MSGLVEGKIVDELRAEIAWLRQVVGDLSKQLDHQSYASFILEKHFGLARWEWTLDVSILDVVWESERACS